jgi:hypothetical protein
MKYRIWYVFIEYDVYIEYDHFLRLLFDALKSSYIKEVILTTDSFRGIISCYFNI